MANNEITVRQSYEDGKEEYRSSESRYNSLEFYYTEKHISFFSINRQVKGTCFLSKSRTTCRSSERSKPLCS